MRPTRRIHKKYSVAYDANGPMTHRTKDKAYSEARALRKLHWKPKVVKAKTGRGYNIMVD